MNEQWLVSLSKFKGSKKQTKNLGMCYSILLYAILDHLLVPLNIS